MSDRYSGLAKWLTDSAKFGRTLEALEEAHKAGSDELLWEMGPVLCRLRFSSRDFPPPARECKGPLYWELELHGQPLPVCASHFPEAMSNPNVTIRRELVRGIE